MMTEQEVTQKIDILLRQLRDQTQECCKQNAFMPEVYNYRDALRHLFKQAGYVQIRKGDLYFSKEQLSQPDPTKGLYNDELPQDKEGT